MTLSSYYKQGIICSLFIFIYLFILALELSLCILSYVYNNQFLITFLIKGILDQHISVQFSTVFHVVFAFIVMSQSIFITWLWRYICMYFGKKKSLFCYFNCLGIQEKIMKICKFVKITEETKGTKLYFNSTVISGR